MRRKLYCGDHGLLRHLLGIDGDGQWRRSSPQRQPLWENLVIMMELINTLPSTQPGTDLFFLQGPEWGGDQGASSSEKNGRRILAGSEGRCNVLCRKNVCSSAGMAPLLKTSYAKACRAAGP
ncbi:MAG: hypothetical protein U5K27_02125 [Desulfotignum sp.]|nr:hypothetical protein [Desulfotignum sp.]